jgi:hypothetical protein
MIYYAEKTGRRTRLGVKLHNNLPVSEMSSRTCRDIGTTEVSSGEAGKKEEDYQHSITINGGGVL